VPDHYVFRMLMSQGHRLEDLGVPRRDGGPVETDGRKIWRLFASNWKLFRGTPSRMWLTHAFETLFGITEAPSAANADRLYDTIDAALKTPAFRPRAMFERMNIEVIATTESPLDDLRHHAAIRASGWKGRVITAYRPDPVVDPEARGFLDALAAFAAIADVDIGTFDGYLEAHRRRRAFFKSMGATATDHAAVSAYTEILSDGAAHALFERALKGTADERDAMRFTGHMLCEMARMSLEDGLVMQLHVGSRRDHNPALYEGFGANMGADIPTATEWTYALKPLLDRFGNDPRLTVVLFTLDETTYSRELAPLAGHYPILRLGPPWWFFDSFNGMRRYFDNVIETAGIYNTAGFNDDTRAYPSIPARHDLWRRQAADWLAGMVARQFIDMDDARDLMTALAYGLAKQTYRL